MPRQGREQQIKNGTLSPNLAAALVEVSPNSIRLLISKGALRRIAFEGTRDLRVSALELLRLWIHRKLPFHRDLLVAARSFATFHEPDRVPEIDATIASFDKLHQHPPSKAEVDSAPEKLEVSTGKTEDANAS